jgi:GcrA cell cycle regulator
MNQYSYNNVWTPERTAHLRRLWREGVSTNVISNALGGGITRMAVIGKAKRLNLGPHPSLVRRRRPRVMLSALPSTTPESKRLSIHDLTAHTCRWPEGHPHEPWFGYCGRFKLYPSEPYCEFHTGIAYQVVPTRGERKLAAYLQTRTTGSWV